MASSEQSVKTFYSKLADVWNANDGAAFAGNFTEDGSLINPFGERADGRGALAAMYGDYFAGMLQGTTTTIEVETVRSVGSDHALADAEQTVFAGNGDVVLAMHVTNLLRRDGDGWQLVDSRPYAFAPPPPA